MALHFTSREFARRKTALLDAMAEEHLDAMLLFQQESMFWLTGYDTFGFCFFQCLVIRADGRMALLTRSADLRQAQRTSLLEDIRIWKDAAEANPARDLLTMAGDMGLQGKRLGVEFESYGLVHANGRKLESAFAGVADLVDASSIVTRLRAIKSPEELVHVHEAARLSDLADAAAINLLAPGVDEAAILAAQHDAVFGNGGDYPANEFIIGSGGDALLCRYKSGRRKLDANDQLTLEFAGVSRHYHAAIMRTHIVGTPKPLHRRYHEAAEAALHACQDAMKPGNSAGDVFKAHADTLDEAGLSSHRLNACGYSLGAKFTPSWMDWPMFYERNPWVITPGMVMFAHMILMDSASETALCLGRTYLVGEKGAEPINAPDLALVVR